MNKKTCVRVYNLEIFRLAGLKFAGLYLDFYLSLHGLEALDEAFDEAFDETFDEALLDDRFITKVRESRGRIEKAPAALSASKKTSSKSVDSKT